MILSRTENLRSCRRKRLEGQEKKEGQKEEGQQKEEEGQEIQPLVFWFRLYSESLAARFEQPRLKLPELLVARGTIELGLAGPHGGCRQPLWLE